MAAGQTPLGPAPAPAGPQGLRKSSLRSDPCLPGPCRCCSALSFAHSAMATSTSIRGSRSFHPLEGQPQRGQPQSGSRCGVAAVSFTFRSGSQLFFDHQGQLGPVRHLLPLPQAQLLVHNLRIIYAGRAEISLA